MADPGSTERLLRLRVEELERERNTLKKDIEQICSQQAGRGFLGVATKLHLQRTAGLEQEIDSLNKKLTVCSRDNQNLQEELQEAYRIKAQLAKLHSAESSKNMDLEKQIKFFQGCLASAFAERDHALMEYEKDNDQKETISLQLDDFQNRVDELESTCAELWKENSALGIELLNIKEKVILLEKVFSKFYKIRQETDGDAPHENWEEKCLCLLNDKDEMWTFDEDRKSTTSKYIASLEHELHMKGNSMASLHNKIQMGLDIEQHLKKKVLSLEKKLITLDDKIGTGLSALRGLHSHHRIEVLNILEEEGIQLKSILDQMYHMMMQNSSSRGIQRSNTTESNIGDVQIDKICDSEYKDLHITSNAETSTDPKMISLNRTTGIADDTFVYSDALAIAMKEKVAALLLLAQQEERHLLERNVHLALQKKMDEMQKHLIQVTNEKVKALMDLASMKRQFQVQQENCSCGLKHAISPAQGDNKDIVFQSRDGRLKDFLKKTYIKSWIGKNSAQEDSFTHTESEKDSLSMEIARLEVENTSLKKSISNVDQLTSSVHKLRLSLLEVRRASESTSSTEGIIEKLNDIIFEANSTKMGLSSLLPVSWSADAVDDAEGEDNHDISEKERLDPILWAGVEMIYLLTLATELLKEKAAAKRYNPEAD